MNKYRIEIKWTIVFFLAGLLWMVLERLVGLHDVRIEQHEWATNLFGIPAIIIYVYALREKKSKFYSGVMTYKQGLMSGIVLSLGVTILAPLSQYITSTIITPHYFTNVIEAVVTAGRKTQAEAEAYFNMKSYIVQGLIGAPIMGLVTSAIVAAFTRTRKKA